MAKLNENEQKLLMRTLANAAQELRGAMANVYEAAGRLAPTELREQNAAADHNASVFWQSYYRMTRVIGNLGDAEELTKTGLFPTLADDDVVGVVRAVCERAQALFEGEGVTLRFASDTPGQIIALDAAYLERLLLNLLSNALKFTKKGGEVSVCLRVTERTVFLSVRDTGCGIAPDKLEHIFDRFLDEHTPDAPVHGMGLGLALCRRIAQGHGGSIAAESREGEGAVFTVALPNRRTGRAALRQQRTSYEGGFNRTLLELSDALGTKAFLCRQMD